jgi:PleD family two-component response regulator
LGATPEVLRDSLEQQHKSERIRSNGISKRKPRPEEPPACRRILVVDDNPLNVKPLAAKLARAYYVVSTVGDGFEALEKIEAEKLDIVLLDVMPGLNGFDSGAAPTRMI